MEDKKKKYAYWMRPSMVEEMESMLSEANAMSKSEFVCQAVEFYMAYLRQNKSLEFFSPLLAQTIKTEVRKCGTAHLGNAVQGRGGAVDSK